MGQEHDPAKKADDNRSFFESPAADLEPAPEGLQSAGNLALQDYYRSGGPYSMLQPDAGNLALQAQACGPDGPVYVSGAVCEPVPDNPLATYPFLLFALDSAQLQDLQDAAFRREHLRRGLPFNGPQGLFFAQAPLANFLGPEAEHLPRQELLAAMMPAMLAAARAHGDVEPYVEGIARNETARLFLESIRNPLVNVEMPDPDGKDDSPTRLEFIVDFREIGDDHGSIPLASLTPISRVPYGLIAATAKVNARQLAEIARLQARTDWMSEGYLEALKKMKDAPGEYAFKQVEGAQVFALELNKEVTQLAQYIWRENQDQASAVEKLEKDAGALEVAANEALGAATVFRTDTDPGRLTMGEHWNKNAQDIREAREKAREEGGVLGNLKVAGNTIGLGANKVVRLFGNVATGGYMQTNADRTSAYRAGAISYDTYQGFSVTDVLKGAAQDLAIMAPGYGGKLGEAAVGLFGVEGGTAAAYVIEGQAVGFVSGTAGAATHDLSSLAASKLAGSADERAFQRSQIGGWESLLEAGSEGATFGTLFGASRLAFPRPTALQGQTSRAAPIEPVKAVEKAEPARTSALVEEPFPVSEMEPGLPSGPMARLKRTALHKLTAAALEGAEPLRDVVGDFGRAEAPLSEPARPAGLNVAAAANELLSVVEEPAPLARPAPAEIQVTEAAPAQPTFELSSQGERPAPGMRLATRTEIKEQEGARRWGMAVDQVVDALEPVAVAESAGVTPDVVPSAVEVNVQAAIRDAIREIRDSGVRSAGNAAYGTRLHAALARILRARQLPLDVTMQVEQALSTFANLPQRVLDMTVRDWLWTDGQAYMWLQDELPGRLLGTTVGDLRIDARVSIGDHSVIFDLTSRELEAHLAKTMLYAALLAQQGKINRVQEYYWVRWRWRGQ